MIKIQKIILSFLLIFVSFFSNIQLALADEDANVIVHYVREDANYDAWNLWKWEDGGSGVAIDATSNDENSTIFEFSANIGSKVGLIIRKGEWEEKNCSDDLFITVEGDTEIWMVENSCEIYTDYSDIAAPIEVVPTVTVDSEAILYVHYFRFDENYTGWNLWSWVKNKDGAAYEFTNRDDFGQLAAIPLNDLSGENEIGLIVRLNEWEAKDIDVDRYVDLSKGQMVDGKLELHVYLVQGVEEIYYDVTSIDIKPSLGSAEWVTKNQILVTSAAGIYDEEGFIVYHNGKEVETSIELIDGDAYLTVDEELIMGDAYEVINENYNGELAVGYTYFYSSDAFNEAFYYDGDDLGATYSKESTNFRLWAPTASQVTLNLYATGDTANDDLIESIPMTSDVSGTWYLSLVGDYNKVYYTYTVEVFGKVNEAVDPYAKAVGVNGHRAMVIDMDATDPEGFENNRPKFSGDFVDSVIYELHVRDLSTDKSSGIENAGKYLGVIEEGTKTPNGVSTGLDHLVDLGITHLHLLPVFDHRSIDETKLSENKFNWGYDPYNYNVPEGSYSSDPYNGEVRVVEFKEMVNGLHNNDIRVVMDVVYNHTGATADSHLNKIVPGYYYRLVNGNFSNGSGCGNETASERAMVRKYIVDSVVYWATEYQIDGFRFDLMALHDIETMNAVREALDKVDPSIIIYGEGWTGGTSPLPDEEKALKVNVEEMDGIAVFSDDMRDGIKGSVFDNAEAGWVSGNLGKSNAVRFGIVGGVEHESVSPYYPVDGPWQTINYVSAHDNLTLWDKLQESTDVDDATRIEMQKMANAIVLTSQGVPFLHAGVDFLRSKDGNHNSYNSTDEVNQLEWLEKEENIDVYNYYKGLIELRKENSDFRLDSPELIQSEINFMESPRGVIAYTIGTSTVVGFNASEEVFTMELPKNHIYKLVVDQNTAGVKAISYEIGSIDLNPYGSYVLVDMTMTIVLIGALILVLLAGIIYYTRKRMQSKK